MKTLTRNQATENLRRRCIELSSEDHCMCEVAARMDVFCRGFARFTFEELKEHYDWIVAKRPCITRRELEDLANRWQLARQLVSGSELSCDNQTQERFHPTCQGWNTFSDEDLARFHQDLCGEEVQVVPDTAP